MSVYLLKAIKFCLVRLKKVFLAIGLALLISVTASMFCLPANAVLRQHHETPGVLRYHAQDSLKDKQGNAWQVVLFPDKQAATKYYLRLVGFPGLVKFAHPRSLEIITSEGKVLTATDAYANSAPANNVGQYDVTEIISQFPQKGSLKLVITLQSDRDLSLKISQQILTEWQLLAKEIES
ncbi:DUF3122 domain-containing protein [Myxosarcina sp. GI1]|uniref:DUF3122 domain-containing protein n=1 Tax=Myxosarcina sp. GI1 TaxID=1541065 RepID=UPI0005643358|nr:DUF3122 domain-containing protein [Myxosarcina sp. GI1]